MQTFEDFVEQSQQAATVPQLKACFQRVMADEGFENHFIGDIVDTRIGEIGWVEFPKGHFEAYVAEGLGKIDPILAYSVRADRAFCWDDVAPRQRLDKTRLDFLEEVKRAGVHGIMVVPFRAHDGRCSIVGISGRHPDRHDPARLPILQAFCAQIWSRHEALTRADVTGAREVAALTMRELEVLNWVKQGKSNGEIAEIMTLSVKTIEHHVGNILRKLGATNRTTAVVIAIKNGMLPL